MLNFNKLRAGLLAATALTATAFSPAHAAATPWESFEITRGGTMVIPVVIEGYETTAAISTGSNVNTINHRFLDQHGHNYEYGPEITLDAGTTTMATRVIKKLNTEIFGAKFTLYDVVPFLFSGSSDLVLGFGFFEQSIVQIDYPNERLRMVTRDSFDLKEFANVKAKKDQSTGRLLAQVTLPGRKKPVWLTVATSTDYGLFVDRKLAKEMGWLDTYQLTETEFESATGTSATMQQFRLPEFTIGPYTLENVKVATPAEGARMNVGRSSVDGSGYTFWGDASRGYVGIDVLKHFVVTMDYKKNRLHLGVPQ